MKTGIFITAFWASVALSCASACAQDTNRVPDIIQGVDAVDASIHSDSVERALQEPQPSKEHVKLPTTYSRWAFNSSGQISPTQYLPVYTIFTTSTAAPADGKSPSTFSRPSFRVGAQPPATAGWSSHATDTKIAPEKDVNFGKFERQPSLYNSLNISRTEHSSTGPQRLKTAVPPNSPLPQADGYLTPFREKGSSSLGWFLDRRVLRSLNSPWSVLVVATAFFLPGTARGLDVNNAEWTILSEGATTCGEFIAEPGMQGVRMEWVLGYISGRNREATSSRDRLIGSSFQQPPPQSLCGYRATADFTA